MIDPKEAQQKQNPEGQPENEGEGSRSADRHYREGVKKTVESGRVEELGEEAAEALDGPEGDELREAEEEGKRRADEVPDGTNRSMPRRRPGQPA